MKYILLFLSPLLFSSCYEVERNCSDFKNGEFEYTYEVDGKQKTSKFIRHGNLEVDYHGSHIDSIQVKWINDCEYVLNTINPKTLAQKKAVHIKILTTTQNTYTFESKIINDRLKRVNKGTVIKIK